MIFRVAVVNYDATLPAHVGNQDLRSMLRKSREAKNPQAARVRMTDGLREKVESEIEDLASRRHSSASKKEFLGLPAVKKRRISQDKYIAIQGASVLDNERRTRRNR